MKKIKLDAAKLQLKKDKITALSAKSMQQVQGGDGTLRCDNYNPLQSLGNFCDQKFPASVLCAKQTAKC